METAHIVLIVLIAIANVAYVKADACVQCNSASDPKCATAPESFLAKSCQNTTSICYTRIQNGNTIRGCASELDNATKTRCNNELECLICSFVEGCNRHVFPTSRAQCLQCTGNSTGECALDTHARPSPCPLYVMGDKCYIRRTNKNDTESFQRGCLSTAQRNKKCTNLNNCFTCEGTGCNFLMAESDQIPRDSATFIAYSIALLFAAIFVTRFA